MLTLSLILDVLPLPLGFLLFPVKSDSSDLWHEETPIIIFFFSFSHGSYPVRAEEMLVL